MIFFPLSSVHEIYSESSWVDEFTAEIRALTRYFQTRWKLHLSDTMRFRVYWDLINSFQQRFPQLFCTTFFLSHSLSFSLSLFSLKITFKGRWWWNFGPTDQISLNSLNSSRFIQNTQISQTFNDNISTLAEILIYSQFFMCSYERLKQDCFPLFDFSLLRFYNSWNTSTAEISLQQFQTRSVQMSKSEIQKKAVKVFIFSRVNSGASIRGNFLKQLKEYFSTALNSTVIAK